MNKGVPLCLTGNLLISFVNSSKTGSTLSRLYNKALSAVSSALISTSTVAPIVSSSNGASTASTFLTNILTAVIAYTQDIFVAAKTAASCSLPLASGRDVMDVINARRFASQTFFADVANPSVVVLTDGCTCLVQLQSHRTHHRPG